MTDLFGKPVVARADLRRQAAVAPDGADVHYELARAHAVLGEAAAALCHAQRAVWLDPSFYDAWRTLGLLYLQAGKQQAAERVYRRQIDLAESHGEIAEAKACALRKEWAEAEKRLRAILGCHADDIVALRLLASVLRARGSFFEARSILRDCLDRVPFYDLARRDYALVLQDTDRWVESMAEIDRLLILNPTDEKVIQLKVRGLVRIGEPAAALGWIERLEYADPATLRETLVSKGAMLSVLGRPTESIAAFHRAIALYPDCGLAYRGLANLKIYRFTAEDRAAMAARLQNSDLAFEDRVGFHFALGKAHEDAALYASSFSHYAAAKALRRERSGQDLEALLGKMETTKRQFPAAIFSLYEGKGCDSVSPIFIVGMPRTGSTLIEQILASHSAVEGTLELPEFPVLMDKIHGSYYGDILENNFCEVNYGFSSQDIKKFGEIYLKNTNIYRKTEKYNFIDKMLVNYINVGFIHIFLPNARVIDVRRHPMAVCFSNFKSDFRLFPDFSVDLTTLGRWYAGYAGLMDHFDRLLPGRIHRVYYERLVDDTEMEVRRLLDYCSLPFEPACLDFWKTERAVVTVSSQQVRQPIFRDALDQWRHFEAWLSPLKEALGTWLENYPYQ